MHKSQRYTVNTPVTSAQLKEQICPEFYMLLPIPPARHYPHTGLSTFSYFSLYVVESVQYDFALGFCVGFLSLNIVSEIPSMLHHLVFCPMNMAVFPCLPHCWWTLGLCSALLWKCSPEPSCACFFADCIHLSVEYTLRNGLTWAVGVRVLSSSEYSQFAALPAAWGREKAL